MRLFSSMWSGIKKGAVAAGQGLKKGATMIADGYKNLDDDTKNKIAKWAGKGVETAMAFVPGASLLSPAAKSLTKHVLGGSEKKKADSTMSISSDSTKSQSGGGVIKKVVKSIVNAKTGKRKLVESEAPSFVTNFG